MSAKQILFDTKARQHIANVRLARHPLTEHGDQVEIALGFPKDLLPAEAIGIGHWPGHPEIANLRKTALLSCNSNRQFNSAKPGVSKSAWIFPDSCPGRCEATDAQGLTRVG